MPGKNRWLEHVKQVKKEHPTMMLKDILKKASSTYQKGSGMNVYKVKKQIRRNQNGGNFYTSSKYSQLLDYLIDNNPTQLGVPDNLRGNSNIVEAYNELLAFAIRNGIRLPAHFIPPIENQDSNPPSKRRKG